MTVQLVFFDNEEINRTKVLVKGSRAHPAQWINQSEIFANDVSKEDSMFYIEFTNQYLNRMREE